MGAFELLNIPIPTLSVWAMGLLAGLLTLGAVFERRRKKKKQA